MRVAGPAVGWLAGRRPADAAQVGGASGGLIGLIVGLWGPWGRGRLGDALAGAGLGGVACGGLALLLCWSCALWVRGAAGGADAPDGQLLDEFRRHSRASVRRQWRVLLDGHDRLPAEFRAYTRIAPPRSFAGSLRHRSDLASAVDASAAPGGGPRLLIVGEPGQGKTVALLDIALHLADVQDNRFGAPVVVNLGSWGSDDDDLAAWIVADLCAATGPMPGADDVVRGWVGGGLIAPILDGLDEITDRESRWRCVQAINAFVDRAPDHLALVVASRPDEYTEVSEDGADRLAVNTAIVLDKFPLRLVAARLRRYSAGACLVDLVETSPTHPVVELLRIPLWLWFAGSLDDDRAHQLTTMTTSDDAREILTDAFLDRSITALDHRQSLGIPRCRRTLAALAGFLTDSRTPDSSTFRLEHLTPPNPGRVTYLATGMLSGLVVAVSIGPLVGLAGGLGVGLGAGLAAASVGGLMAISERIDGRPARARVEWPGVGRLVGGSLRGILASAGVSVALGPIVGVASGLAGALFGEPSAGLRLGLLAGLLVAGGMLMGGVLSGLFGGLVSSNVLVSDVIDEGRSASMASVARHAVIAGLMIAAVSVLAAVLGYGRSGLVPGLIFGLTVGPCLGAVFGLDEGGWYLVLQRRLRRMARREGLLPDDVVGFLTAGVEVRVLRRTGGGVQFRHRTLVDRLAREAPAPGLADLRQRLGTDTEGSPFAWGRRSRTKSRRMEGSSSWRTKTTP